MKDRVQYHIHVGTASILLIFMTLCLVSFAVLSIAGANADYKLSRKLADRTSAYYAACSQGMDFLLEADAAQDGYSGLQSAEPSSSAEELVKRFPISETQYLEVRLLPRDSGDTAPVPGNSFDDSGDTAPVPGNSFDGSGDSAPVPGNPFDSPDSVAVPASRYYTVAAWKLVTDDSALVLDEHLPVPK